MHDLRDPMMANTVMDGPKASPAEIRNNDWLFAILVAFSFWGWLAKDFLLDLFLPPMAAGKLAATTAVVLVPQFIAGRLPGLNRALSIQRPRTQTMVMIFAFFFYSTMSGFLTGNDAFTRFKLVNLLISIAMAYILAGKTICAIAINKTHFVAVGILVGVAGLVLLFGDVSSYGSTLGLRELSVAHLNVQDFYVVVFLGATAVFFSGSFSLVRLLLWAGASLISLPTAIAVNSRMLPFTLGLAILYMIVALRLVAPRRGSAIRNLVFLALVMVASVFAKNSIKTESRLMTVFDLGVMESYAEDPRPISFAEAFDNFVESPIEGIGFGKFMFPGGHTDPTDRQSGFWPHNLLLELLSELGLLGLVLFMVPFGPTLKNVLLAKFASNEESRVFPALVLVYVFTAMQLSYNISYTLFWLAYFCCEVAFPRREVGLMRPLRDSAGSADTNTSLAAPRLG